MPGGKKIEKKKRKKERQTIPDIYRDMHGAMLAAKYFHGLDPHCHPGSLIVCGAK